MDSGKPALGLCFLPCEMHTELDLPLRGAVRMTRGDVDEVGDGMWTDRKGSKKVKAGFKNCEGDFFLSTSFPSNLKKRGVNP